MKIFSTRLTSTLFPLSREVLSYYTNIVSKVLKLYMRQRLGQHICNLFIYANIMELYGSFAPYHECNDIGFLCVLTCHGTHGSMSFLCNFGYHIESWLLPSPDQIDLSTTSEAIWLHNWRNMQQCIPLLLCSEQC
jgi:hypothetical protein